MDYLELVIAVMSAAQLFAQLATLYATLKKVN